MKSNSAAQEQGLKEQLHSVQEQAQHQLQEVSAQLQAKGAAMEERDREAREQRGKLEADIGSLRQQLLAKNEELQNMEKTVKEVSMYSQVVIVIKLMWMFPFRH